MFNTLALVFAAALTPASTHAQNSDFFKQRIGQIGNVFDREERMRMINEILPRALSEGDEETDGPLTNLETVLNLRAESCKAAPNACLDTSRWDRAACFQMLSVDRLKRLWNPILAELKSEAAASKLHHSQRGCYSNAFLRFRLFEIASKNKWTTLRNTIESSMRADLANGATKNANHIFRGLSDLHSAVTEEKISTARVRSSLKLVANSLKSIPPAAYSAPTFVPWLAAVTRDFSRVGLQRDLLAIIETVPDNAWPADSVDMPLVVLQSCGLLRLSGKTQTCQKLLQLANSRAIASKSREFLLLLGLEKVEIAGDAGNLEDATRELTHLESLAAEIGPRARTWTMNSRVRLAVRKGSNKEVSSHIDRLKRGLVAMGETTPSAMIPVNEAEVVRLLREKNYKKACELAEKLEKEALASTDGDEGVDAIVATRIQRLLCAVNLGDDSAKEVIAGLKRSFRIAPFSEAQSLIVEVLELASQGKSHATPLEKLRNLIGPKNFYFENLSSALSSLPSKQRRESTSVSRGFPSA